MDSSPAVRSSPPSVPADSPKRPRSDDSDASSDSKRQRTSGNDHEVLVVAVGGPEDIPSPTAYGSDLVGPVREPTRPMLRSLRTLPSTFKRFQGIVATEQKLYLDLDVFKQVSECLRLLLSTSQPEEFCERNAAVFYEFSATLWDLLRIQEPFEPAEECYNVRRYQPWLQTFCENAALLSFRLTARLLDTTRECLRDGNTPKTLPFYLYPLLASRFQQDKTPFMSYAVEKLDIDTNAIAGIVAGLYNADGTSITHTLDDLFALLMERKSDIHEVAWTVQGVLEILSTEAGTQARDILTSSNIESGRLQIMLSLIYEELLPALRSRQSHALRDMQESVEGSIHKILKNRLELMDVQDVRLVFDQMAKADRALGRPPLIDLPDDIRPGNKALWALSCQYLWQVHYAASLISTEVLSWRMEAVNRLGLWLSAEYKSKVSKAPASCLKILAHIVGTSGIVPHLFSAQSHARLLDAGQLVVTFLAAAGEWNTNMTNCIWSACTRNAEDEFLAVASAVLYQASAHLTLPQLLEIVKLYSTTSPQALNQSIVSIFRHLLERITGHGEGQTSAITSIVTRLCIDILCMTQDSTLTAAHRSLRHDALCWLFPAGTVIELAEVLDRCVPLINNHTALATTGYLMLRMYLSSLPAATRMQHHGSHEAVQATKELPVAATSNTVKAQSQSQALQDILSMLPIRIAIHELEAFMQRHTEQPSEAREKYTEAILCRIEVIVLLIDVAAEEAISVDLEARFWLAIDAFSQKDIARQALDVILTVLGAREVSHTLRSFVQRRMDKYLPVMDAKHATPELIHYLHTHLRSQLPSASATGYSHLKEQSNWQHLLRLKENIPEGHLCNQVMTCICDIVLHNYNIHDTTGHTLHYDFICEHIDTISHHISTLHNKPEASSPLRCIGRSFTILNELLNRDAKHGSIVQEELLSPDVLDEHFAQTIDQNTHIRVQVVHNKQVLRIMLVTMPPTTTVTDLLGLLHKHLGVADYETHTLALLSSLATCSIDELKNSTNKPTTLKPVCDATSDFGKLTVRSNTIKSDLLASYHKLRTMLDEHESVAVQAYRLLQKLVPPAEAVEEVRACDYTSLHSSLRTYPYQLLYNIQVLRYQLSTHNRFGVRDQRFVQYGFAILVAIMMSDLEALGDTVTYETAVALREFTTATRDGMKSSDGENNPELRCEERTSKPPVQAQELLVLCLRMMALMSDAAVCHNVRNKAKSDLVHTLYLNMLCCCQVQPSIFSALTQGGEFFELHKDMIATDIGNVFSLLLEHVVANFAQNAADEVSITYLRTIMRLLPDILQHRSTAANCFNFLLRLVQDGSNRGWCTEVLLKELLDRLEAALRDYQHIETTLTRYDDRALYHLLRFTLTIVERLKSMGITLQKQALARYIFDRYLFADQQSERVCGNEDSSGSLLHSPNRSCGYHLVNYLCEDSKDFNLFLGKLKTNINAKGTVLDHFARPAEFRPPWCPAGLTNLGTTCYMNALLQQIFGNVRLRKSILDIPIHNQAKQKVLVEVQRLFANMQDLAQREVDTTKAAKCFGINVCVQEDVHAFYTLLIGSLENSISDPSDRTTFINQYTGNMTTQIRGSCGHVSSRDESFSELSLTVQGHASLKSSLSAFFEGEQLQGDNMYKCTTCQPESSGLLVEARKRTGLERVPDCLTICLKRCEWDVYGQEQKDSSVFHFDEFIDLAPYQHNMQQNLARAAQADTFLLTGIIVHTGTLSAGHYWSFVRSRTNHDPPGQWMRLEDSNVRFVSREQMHDECVGGRPFDPSAYVLLYERIDSYRSSPAICEPISARLPDDYQAPPRVAIPSPYKNEIRASNDSTYQNAYLSHQDLRHFMEALTNGAAKQMQRDTPVASWLDGNSSSDITEEGGSCTIVAEALAAYSEHILLISDEPDFDLIQQSLQPMIQVQACAAATFLMTLLEPTSSTTMYKAYQYHDAQVAEQMHLFILVLLQYIKHSQTEAYPQVLECVLTAHHKLITTSYIDPSFNKWSKYIDFVAAIATLGEREHHKVMSYDYVGWVVDVLSAAITDDHASRHAVICERKWDDVAVLYKFLHQLTETIAHAEVLSNDEDRAMRRILKCYRVQNHVIIPWLANGMVYGQKRPSTNNTPARLLSELLAIDHGKWTNDVRTNEKLRALVLITVKSTCQEWQLESNIACPIIAVCIEMKGDTYEARQLLTCAIEEMDKQQTFSLDFFRMLWKSFRNAPSATMTACTKWFRQCFDSTDDACKSRALKLMDMIMQRGEPFGDLERTPDRDDFDISRIKYIIQLMRNCLEVLDEQANTAAVKARQVFAIDILSKCYDFAERLKAFIEDAMHNGDIAGAPIHLSDELTRQSLELEVVREEAAIELADTVM